MISQIGFCDVIFRGELVRFEGIWQEREDGGEGYYFKPDETISTFEDCGCDDEDDNCYCGAHLEYFKIHDLDLDCGYDGEVFGWFSMQCNGEYVSTVS